jgi:hypothetical protein
MQAFALINSQAFVAGECTVGVLRDATLDAKFIDIIRNKHLWCSQTHWLYLAIIHICIGEM